jgi:uncharacterized membrane protein
MIQMIATELSHVLFRWIHVLAAVMWVGQLWSLALVLRLTPDRAVDPGLAVLARRAHAYHRWSAALTWATGFPLLGIVYYGGGAMTGVDQSFGRASLAGLAAIVGAFPVYDALWRVLRRHRPTAAFLSLALFTAAAAGLQRVMTGRAVFIHLGAMLGTIMLANAWQRIWPVERRRLTGPTLCEPSSTELVTAAALRLRHNVALAVAVMLFMVSNHFPLVYGHSRGWLLAPGIVVTGWIVTSGDEWRSIWARQRSRR